jgi:hypothetical protein
VTAWDRISAPLPVHPDQHQTIPAIKEGTWDPWNPGPSGPLAGPLSYPNLNQDPLQGLKALQPSDRSPLMTRG